MKPRSRHSGLWAVGLMVLALFAATEACINSTNVPPNNPEVVKSIASEGLSLAQYMQQIGMLPPQSMAPWIISPDAPLQGGGTVTFKGYGPNQDDLHSSDVPTIVLFEALPNGCADVVQRGRQLATVSSSSSREWELTNIEIPADVAIVSTAVRYHNQDGPLGNLVVINSSLLKPVVVTPPQDQRVGVKANIAGEAMPGLCVELWRDAQNLTNDKADENRKWEIKDVPINPGVNLIEVRVWIHGESNLYTSLDTYKITGPPQIIWPFGEMENNTYKPDLTKGYITTWFGFNDFYWNHYADLKTNFHSGLDIGGVNDQVVRSVADGTIKKANLDETDDNYCGINVVVVHAGGWTTRYCHLKEIDKELLKIKDEQSIPAGTPLGIVGCTGHTWDAKQKKWLPNCFGPHLHLDVLYASQYMNLNPPPGQSLLSFTSTPDDTTATEPEMKYCYGTSNIWNLDWPSVKYKDDDGTSFSKMPTCPTDQVCKCEK
jgi:murein DD-endopeptidase MepM/ murein hydrolase activator NlpD